MNEDGSSFFRVNRKSAEARQEDISAFFREHQIQHVDLMKINIEGGEYDVLERMIETGLVQDVRNIQVQFHDFVPQAKSRMNEIQDKLKSTHFLTYQYEFVWENWERQ